MAPPVRSRPIRKNDFPTFFKPLKPVLFSESTSARPGLLAPRIGAISWSPTGSLVASCTATSIRIWNPERPNIKSSTELRNAHPKGGAAYGSASGDIVEKIAFCPTTEGVLASTGHDGMVRLWDVRTPGGAAVAGGKGTPLADCRVGNEGHFLTWHPSGREMLVGRKDDVIHSVDMRRMVDFDGSAKYDLEATERSPAKDKSVYYVMAFSNSGRELFATTHEGPVKVFDYPSMSLLHTLSGHAAQTYTVQQSPTGTYLAVGGADGVVSLWDTHTWFCANALTAHTASVKDVSFSFDGTYVAAGSGNDAKDGSPGMEIYHADTGDVVHTIDTVNPVTYVAWHPTRYWIAYAGDPGGLKLVGPGSSVI